jgi:hypothetical protein
MILVSFTGSARERFGVGLSPVFQCGRPSKPERSEARAPERGNGHTSNGGLL